MIRPAKSVIAVIIYMFNAMFIPAFSDESAATLTHINAPASGIDIGLGWQNQAGIGELVPNRCLDYSIVNEPSQSTNLELHEVFSKSDIAEHLNVEVAGEAAIGPVDVSGSASFAYNSNIKSSQKHYLLIATINNGTIFAGPTRPQPNRYVADFLGSGQESTVDAILRYFSNKQRSQAYQDQVGFKQWVVDGYLSKNNETGQATTDMQDQFRQACGDYYVSAMHTGLKAYALISFNKTSTQEDLEIAAKLSASFGEGGGSVSTKASKDKTNLYGQFDIRYHQVGGTSGPIPTSLETLVSKMQVLASEAALAPKIYAVDLKPYNTVVGWPENWTITPIKSAGNDSVEEVYATLSDVVTTIQGIRMSGLADSAYHGMTLNTMEAYGEKLNEIRRKILNGDYKASGSETAGNTEHDNILKDLKQAVYWPHPVDTSDTTFNPLYAYLRLPVPVDWYNYYYGGIGFGTPVQSYSIDHYLGDRVVSRCVTNPIDPECINLTELYKARHLVPVYQIPRKGGTGYYLVNLCSAYNFEREEYCLSVNVVDEKVTMTTTNDPEKVTWFWSHTASATGTDDKDFYYFVSSQAHKLDAKCQPSDKIASDVNCYLSIDNNQWVLTPTEHPFVNNDVWNDAGSDPNKLISRSMQLEQDSKCLGLLPPNTANAVKVMDCSNDEAPYFYLSSQLYSTKLGLQ